MAQQPDSMIPSSVGLYLYLDASSVADGCSFNEQDRDCAPKAEHDPRPSLCPNRTLFNWFEVEIPTLAVES